MIKEHKEERTIMKIMQNKKKESKTHWNREHPLCVQKQAQEKMKQ